MKSNFTLYCRHYQFTTTNYRNTNPNNKDNNDYKAFIFPLIMNKWTYTFFIHLANYKEQVLS